MFLCNKLYTSNSCQPCTMCEVLTTLSLNTTLDNHALEFKEYHQVTCNASLAHALTTPEFPSGFKHDIVGDYVKK